MRLAILRGSVVVGAVAVAWVEILSLLNRIGFLQIISFWGTALAVAAGAAAWRLRQGAPKQWERSRAGMPERIGAVAVVLLVLAELGLALIAAPNNYDSYSYHLPKVEHWVANHSVDIFATPILRQVVFAPGAEYLLLHLRLLTGGDGAHNLVQWAAGVLCLVVASRIAAQFGAGPRGQLLTVFLVATSPMVVLQSTSTQTDLVTAAWLACTASLIVDELNRRTRVTNACLMGAAAGLVAVTKSTGVLGLLPILALWTLAQLRVGMVSGGQQQAVSTPARMFRAFGRFVAPGLVAAAMVVAVAGPFSARLAATFGSPFGSPDFSALLILQRHDPPVLLVNALRWATSPLLTPVSAANRTMTGAVSSLAGAMEVDVKDPQTTFGVSKYPDWRWWPDEDHAPSPVQVGLLFIGVGATLVSRRIPGTVRAYAVAVTAGAALFPLTLKWQEWGNRLVLPTLVVAAPVAGWWLERLLRSVMRPRWNRAVAGALVCLLVAGVGFGYLSVLRGSPRPLVGHNSVLANDEWSQRFWRQPTLADEYRWTAGKVVRSGAKRVGVVMEADAWEYPWWLLFPGRELVQLVSVVPGHPAADSGSVDAIVCVAWTTGYCTK
ncbi:MAG: hypothetical protein JXA67_21215, partial [Micromonosporaceae bacterium]|nr:hypothetical protein [Micromonosporaceae bacterium]